MPFHVIIQVRAKELVEECGLVGKEKKKTKQLNSGKREVGGIICGKIGKSQNS